MVSLHPIDTPPAVDQPRSFLTELSGWLSACARQFRAARQYAPATHFEVARDIAADAVRENNAIARLGYSAEQADREALRLLNEAARDGLQASDMAAVATACRLIRRSAETDHDIAERATCPASL